MNAANRPARAATVARWPLGIGLVAWRYLWRTTPLHRSDIEGDATDLPPDRDGGQDHQGLDAGVGPMLHRTFSVRIRRSPMSAARLVDEVTTNLDRVSPEMVTFRKTTGPEGGMGEGDEYVVRMPGPWNGPVRVIRRTPTSFEFATLDGHLEAGQIAFRARPDGADLVFEIEAWARAGDRLSHLLYNRLKLAKEIQLNMWTHFCVHSAGLAGGTLQDGVTIRTRRIAWPPPAEWSTAGG